jgi:hypothetical protein
VIIIKRTLGFLQHLHQQKPDLIDRKVEDLIDTRASMSIIAAGVV